MTYRFTGSPALRYLETIKETKRTHLPHFIAEDELIKHLIAYEPIFANANGKLIWELNGCSVINADLTEFCAAIEDLLLSILNHGVAPHVAISSEANIANVLFSIAIFDKNTKARADIVSSHFQQLMRSINAEVNFTESAAGLVVAMILPTEQRVVNGEHPAERQINKYNLNELAKFSSEADSFRPLLLVVEPNNELRGFLKQLLQSDYRVLEAIDGKQALKTATSDIPDLIITDVLLQELDGLSLIKELSTQDSTSHIPVMFLTGIKATETKIDALTLGAVDYLTKPFDAAELLLKIRNVVQTRYRVVLTNGGRLPVDRLKNALPEREIKFLTALERNLASQFANALLDTTLLASNLAMSERQLQRKLKALLNQTPAEYIREYRLHRAKDLLLKGKSVSLVADLVGFTSSSHFSRSFKSTFQQSPSEFIQAYTASAN